ncbi:hypothetical protein BSKO_09000 [Bryopsis sp. KO-2023]|nr:hypothetical protein BSKO_09000 [Bryopsis sp. KO-2023]
MAGVTSSSGLLALLSEEDEALKLYALQHLNRVVPEFWFQISGAISNVERLYEDKGFSHRELAALVLSKVFYHLGELKDSLDYALGAGRLFDIDDGSEYVRTLVARALDQYFELRTRQVEEGKADVEIDPSLEAIVERMLDRCCQDGQFEQGVGIALESRRLDLFERVVRKSPNPTTTLSYALRVSHRLVVNRDFRQKVLRLLVELYSTVPDKDWVNICQCLMFLNDHEEVAKILAELIRGGEQEMLLAYQIGFDLVENEVQSFLLKVQSHLESIVKVEEAPGTAQPLPVEGEGTDLEPSPPQLVVPEAIKTKYNRVKDTISGKIPIHLYLDFLYNYNHSDLQILKNVKAMVDARHSVCHSATVWANSIMHCGTTVDTFLRDNLDWLSRATNWAKFSATAGLGVIHKGHLENGRALMAPYLPQNGASGSPYSEGGALYALGLIHANHGHDIQDFLLQSLRNAQSEVIQHGACLGLGIAALGTEDEGIFEDVKNVLFSDSAIAGEAAGVALGLLHVGSATAKSTEMLSYAHDTQHEKIIRGVALGLALIMYGREEGAETLIEQMTRDQDPILRYGGMYVIGLAYRGTDNNVAIQKLLHFAVSDVSDDVRRAAVLCLGFVLMGVPHQCPRIVSLLAESYNPHVRYGSAMAVGIACAGTGLKDAVDLLTPMLSDAVDFVRQGSLIAMAMVLTQQPETQMTSFRKVLNKFINDKGEEMMCRMGAIMAAGILDAGGRNVTIGLRSHSGHFRRTSVIGLAIFTQYWYWYPLSYFLSLAFHPTVMIGLNGDLDLPKFDILCECKKSLYAYPVPVTEETSQQTAKLPTAVLSTTVRAKERARKKEQEKRKAKGGQGPSTSENEPSDSGAMELDEPEPSKPQEKPEAEPDSHLLKNPARVVPNQEKYVRFLEDSRWVPIKQGAQVGILILKDMQPGEPVELIGGDKEGEKTDGGVDGSEDEPAPPEPFEYTPP